MKTTLALTVFTMALIPAFGTSRTFAAYPETREYLLGDIDNFQYGGTGSVDDVYVDPDFWTLTLPHTYANGMEGFDDMSNNHGILFTFVFDLSAGEQVTAATLTVAMRAISSVDNDTIDLDMTARGDELARYDFSDLGWLPISTEGTSIRTIDLAEVYGCYDHPTVPDDLLPKLQDGKFNVMVHDDEAIDYATLTLEIMPEVIPGDANLDGSVDLQDFGILKANFGREDADWSMGDFTGNGAVGLQDFGLLKANFGTGGGTGGQAIPEPATLSLLATGGLALMRRKK